MATETDLMRLVKEDLDYLTEEWNQDIDDSSLRRTSPVLRSLLIENQLIKVANLLNETVYILAPLISDNDNYFNDPSVVFYQSGGARYKGMEIQFLRQLNRSISAEEIKATYEMNKLYYGQSYPVKLPIFMKQISFIVNGVKINREEVIKYIANKRGGAHFDSVRKVDKVGSKGELEKKYTLLDNIHNNIQVADKNAVYYELLSIGQRLVASPDVQRIREISKNVR